MSEATYAKHADLIPMEVDNVAAPARNWISELPDEILEMILEHLLIFPNGIHEERWRSLQKIRVQPFARRGLYHIVRDVMYKHNTVYVKPRLTFQELVPRSFGPAGLIIRYPPPTTNQRLRTLVVELPKDELESSARNQMITWLKKLESGVLGFPNLENLTLKLKENQPNWEGTLTTIATFRIKELNIFVGQDDHSCTASHCVPPSWDGERDCLRFSGWSQRLKIANI